MMQQIMHLPQPDLAAVNGVAAAAGCQLVLVRSRGPLEAARFVRPACRSAFSAPRDGGALRQARKQSRDGNVAHRRNDSCRPRLRMGLLNRVVAPGREYEKLCSSPTPSRESAYVQKIGKEAFYRQRT